MKKAPKRNVYRHLESKLERLHYYYLLTPDLRFFEVEIDWRGNDLTHTVYVYQLINLDYLPDRFELASRISETKFNEELSFGHLKINLKK